MAEFIEFPKIPRLNRPVIITEKIDGTNACVIVQESESNVFEERTVYAQSRNRIITPDQDNYRFARWVSENADTLKQLGPGHHYGEWWGNGIQRGYGLEGGDKRFSLFNTYRWGETRPACCHVVPVIAVLDGLDGIRETLKGLIESGSHAAPGFMKPEGIIVYHSAARMYFKATCENDGTPKGLQNV